MEKITSNGQYVSKKSGQAVEFTFSYVAYATLEEAIAELGEDKVLKNLQRMVKLDASNTAREGAKVANGDGTHKVMSESEKAEAKAQRATDKALLAKIKGLSAEDREALGL